MLGTKIKQAFQSVFSNFRYWAKNPLILLRALGFTLIHMLATFLIVKILIEGMGERMPFGQVHRIVELAYFITLLPFHQWLGATGSNNYRSVFSRGRIATLHEY